MEKGCYIGVHLDDHSIIFNHHQLSPYSKSPSHGVTADQDHLRHLGHLSHRFWNDFIIFCLKSQVDGSTMAGIDL